MTKSKLYYTVILLLLFVIIILLSFSYAYFQKTKKDNAEITAGTRCLNLSIVSEQNAINLQKAIPISDEEGAALTPFTITIKNTCNSVTEYNANLEMLSETTLDSKYLAIKINDQDQKILNTLEEVDTTISGAKEGRNLTTGILGPNESDTINIRIWLHKDVPYSSETVNKIFASKVVISGTMIKDDTKYTLTGTIIAPEIGPNPLPNKEIAIFTPTDDDEPVITLTDPDGNITAPDLPRGCYEIYYDEEGYEGKTKSDIVASAIYIGKVCTNGETNISSTGSGSTLTSVNNTKPSCYKPETDHKLLCHRATELHTEPCKADLNNHTCNAIIGYDNAITYGNSTFTSGEYHTGDAFTCDVNADGIYNETTERFYYVSDYYNPNTNEFDPQYATLVFYSNISGVTITDGLPNKYGNNVYSGPTVAATLLPTVSQWKNTRLIQAVRQIRSVPNTDNPLNNYTYFSADGTNQDLPYFDYSPYAARLLTAQEIIMGCGITAGSETNGQLDTSTCRFLLENTKYSSNAKPIGYWLENPRHGYRFSIYYVSGEVRYDLDRVLMSYYYDNASTGIRPTIDVAKSELEC